jgi:hypothetical protein
VCYFLLLLVPICEGLHSLLPYAGINFMVEKVFFKEKLKKKLFIWDQYHVKHNCMVPAFYQQATIFDYYDKREKMNPWIIDSVQVTYI